MMKVNRGNFIRSSATVASGVATATVGTTKAASVWSKTRGVSPNDRMTMIKENDSPRLGCCSGVRRRVMFAEKGNP